MSSIQKCDAKASTWRSLRTEGPPTKREGQLERYRLPSEVRFR